MLARAIQQPDMRNKLGAFTILRSSRRALLAINLISWHSHCNMSLLLNIICLAAFSVVKLSPMVTNESKMHNAAKKAGISMPCEISALSFILCLINCQAIDSVGKYKHSIIGLMM